MAIVSGLGKTFQVLVETRNDAAVDLLLEALSSRDADMRRMALRALLDRRSPDGLTALLARWHAFDKEWRSIVAERASRIEGALRSAILSTDPTLHRNACEAVVYLNNYDLVPTLIRAAEDKGNPQADVAGQAIVEMSERLYGELNSPRDYSKRRDPVLVRQFIHRALEGALERFEQHRRSELVDAFLILATHDNVTLKQSLRDSDSALHHAICHLLLTSQRPSIITLLLSILDAPQAPTAVQLILARRRDPAFLDPFFAKARAGMRPPMQSNLRRIDAFAWLRDDLQLWSDWTDQQLVGALQVIIQSGVNRLKAFDVVHYVMTHGGPQSRRAASAAIVAFKGGAANELCLRALEDPDPQVQANITRQLRERGIPGVLPRLLELIESKHECVQQAAREALSEFNFQRYLSAFEMLEPEVQRYSGGLVSRVDPTAIEQLEIELNSPMRNRRLRGIEVAVAMGVIPQVEASIVQMATDPDHFVRAEAARALVDSQSENARRVLSELAADRSVSVQEAARESLEQLNAKPHAPPGPPIVPPIEMFPCPHRSSEGIP